MSSASGSSGSGGDNDGGGTDGGPPPDAPGGSGSGGEEGIGATGPSEPVEIVDLSLSQVVLAPLDALFKAQVHAARSFLSLLLQVGFRHKGDGSREDEAFAWEFHIPYTEPVTGKRSTARVRVPTLALAPLQPLSIASADYEVELMVRRVGRHKQFQRTRAKAALEQEKRPTDPEAVRQEQEAPRPWYLVENPISIRGTLGEAPSPTTLGPSEAAEEGAGEKALRDEQRATRARYGRVKVKVHVDRVPVPAGLSRLLTTLTESITLEPDATPARAEPPEPPEPTAPKQGEP